MSHDQDIRNLADLFATSAEEIISGSGFWRTDMATSQALLLNSVFEAGKGNVSKSWMLSGKLAFLIGNHELTDFRNSITDDPRSWPP